MSSKLAKLCSSISFLECQLCIDKKIDAENICRMAGNIKIEEDGENQLTSNFLEFLWGFFINLVFSLRGNVICR